MTASPDRVARINQTFLHVMGLFGLLGGLSTGFLFSLLALQAVDQIAIHYGDEAAGWLALLAPVLLLRFSLALGAAWLGLVVASSIIGGRHIARRVALSLALGFGVGWLGHVASPPGPSAGGEAGLFATQPLAIALALLAGFAGEFALGQWERLRAV